jgi:kumamolisin
MGSRKIRLNASGHLFIAFYLMLASVVAFSRLLAQGTPQLQDLGPTDSSKMVTASLVLKVQHPDLLEAYVASTQDPNSPSYHRFVSLPDFVFRFAPKSSDIFILTQYLKLFGIQVTDIYADHLLIKANGTVDAFDKAFSFAVHDFSREGRRFHRPLGKPRIPRILQDILVTVFGPSDEARFHPMNLRVGNRIASPLRQQGSAIQSQIGTATGIAGEYTVADLANFYDINPLYKAHIDGRGQTVGIATLANFLPADAYAYWKLINLKVLPNRITQVHVDGGAELSADAGSGETSLDVEQSGGVAPNAKIIVYDAPNTNPGFIDLFYKAASDNLVDSLSVSWGAAEIFYFESVGGEDDTGQFPAFHQAFLELAAQGISTFASSGDNGAYDGNDAFDDPVNNVLTVDSPGSDPAITAAGGTTRPFVLPVVDFPQPSPPSTLPPIPPTAPPLVVTTEQVWGWDYIQNYVDRFGGPAWKNVWFPGGGGGGVSFIWPLPAYQSHTPGIRRTEPGQRAVADGQVLLNLPAHFPGRNVPDVSLNADPFSGYLLVSTEDAIDGDPVLGGAGGTSFVAPQLNGISALISQATGGGRIGLWNPMLYRFQRNYGYGKGSPFVDITAGDNWFYHGVPGYEPGAGLGVLDVTKLAIAVAHDSQRGFPPRVNMP